jgi:dTMP kinase
LSPKSANQRGFFLVVEGADGSGKTTLARHLARLYRRRGRRVCTVREPGGTRVSERVRRLLLHPGNAMSARAELFLYLAARAQVVDDVIRPALARGELVIADRFSLSTLAYQVGGRGLPLPPVMTADRLARGGLAPDLTIVLTVSLAEAARRRKRMKRAEDRIERESRLFHRAVSAFYAAYGRSRPHCRLIDSHAGPDEVFRQAVAIIDRRLAARMAPRRQAR